MTTPPLTKRDADRIATTVAGIAVNLARHTNRHSALAWSTERAKAWQPGVRSALGATGRGGSGISDPTGQAATRDYDDPTARWAGELATAARRLEACALLVERLCARIDGHDEPRPRDRTTQCRNPYCETIIETSMSEYAGLEWCSPCYDYRLRNGRDASHEVIAARERKRRERDMSRTGADA